ncbi:RNA-directed DNA polymerase, eukaryota, reverse transcriptase zinc-binding domain protein [Tanacetum coccineum]|uniref:RNA-directed DNA polymerase, eukaryota, reverse transcriptase zinc-binding domain protein n=1 Tax=Tanacetum coccineum TaxID=301880 RepID=A0ABQ5HSU0_9ASTR
MGITHLCFADDLMLLCHANKISTSILRRALDEFSLSSRLYPSMVNSTIYFRNVPNDVKCSILMFMSFNEGVFPTKYLGVPLVSRKLYKEDCKFLIENVTKRIKDWRNKCMSYAGRLQLIASILSSLQIYWSSIFVLPANVCPLSKVINHDTIVFAHLSLNAKVKDMVRKSVWQWPRGRLKTQDRLSKWLNILDMSYPFCKSCKDSHSHLFFDPPYSKRLWERLKAMARLEDISSACGEIVFGISNKPASSGIWSVIQRLVLGAVVYFVWQERNFRLFRKCERSNDKLFSIITKTVRLKLMGLNILKASLDVKKAAEMWNFPLKLNPKDSMKKQGPIQIHLGSYVLIEAFLDQALWS